MSVVVGVLLVFFYNSHQFFFIFISTCFIVARSTPKNVKRLTKLFRKNVTHQSVCVLVQNQRFNVSKSVAFLNVAN